jgi:hypothetical protein
VRKLPAAFAISAALHITVMVYLAIRVNVTVKTRVHAPPAPLPPPRALQPHTDEPVAVMLFEEPRHGPPSGSLGGPQIKTSTSHGGQHETGPTGPSHSKWMSMRGPGEGSGPRPSLGVGLSQEFFDNFFASSRPLAPGPPEPSGELRPSGHGTFRSHHKTFDAHIHRDGTVSLHDEPDFKFELGPGGQIMRFGADDAIMRAFGIDPYASAKLQWLDKTRDERAAIGLANRKYDLAHSAQFMQQNLAWLWAKTTDPAERKQALFELWDEVAETGDDELVQGGAAARAYLIGFVRSHLPRGTANAFTADELAKLNAHRTSHEKFAPYP